VPREENAASEPGTRAPLAKIRHDLRTPVNHIIGFSEMLLEEATGRTSESFVQDLQKIRNGGEHLLTLINQHLSGRSLPAARRDLHDLCHELRTPVNHIIGYSELLMEQCAELGRADFLSDLNRIKNAAKTWLAIMEKHLIATDDPERERACQTEHETELPIQQSVDTILSKTQSRAPANSGRLLLADDDPINRELLGRRLEKLGYQVTECVNGREALELASTGGFDLVLLDLLMPELDGAQVLARMKADPKLQHVPVIMISALDEVSGIARCIELGAEDYVAKPFNPVFLRARVGAALEKKRLRDREVSYLRQIQEEKQRSEELLHIILPQDVAEELKATKVVQPRRFENVGVLFCDIVGFTSYCDRHPPEEILRQLQAVVEAFEEITARHGLEKIKTVGDSFVCTIGLRTPVNNPGLDCTRCGLEMIGASRRLPPHWQVRVGVHVGPVIAGVVGHRKYQYDIWGDTVNLAARMEKAAAPGTVCVTAETWHLVREHYSGRAVGRMDIKGKGLLELYLIESG
jgi:class 3 adenylate cyclase/CheY-like chemotaxis protein